MFHISPRREPCPDFLIERIIRLFSGFEEIFPCFFPVRRQPFHRVSIARLANSLNVQPFLRAFNRNIFFSFSVILMNIDLLLFLLFLVDVFGFM